MTRGGAGSMAWFAACAMVWGGLFVGGCGDDSEPGSSAGGGAAGSGGAGSGGAGGEGGTPSGGTGGTGAGGSGGTGAGGIGGSGGSGGSGGDGGSGGTAAGGSGGSGGSATIDCGPLPMTGNVQQVSPSQAGTLHEIVAAAASGTTLVLENGTYAIGQTLRFTTAGVTLRSVSNDAASVVIDGQYAIDETVAISASDVTLAHVTITRAVNHPIHVYPPGAGIDVTGPLLYGLRLVDGGEQFLKVNPIVGQAGYVDQGRVECSEFRMTDEGRTHVEPCCGGCYTGGIDVHSGMGWVVRNNRFEGIHCTNGGLAEHAVHFWRGSRDTLVENNVIVNCGRGVGFGLDGGTGERVYADAPYGGMNLAHYDGIIRNNVIYADNPWYDTGIEVHDAREPIVVHNTVISTASATGFFSSIDYRFPQTVVRIQNNLTNRITLRDSAQGTVENNLENTPLDLFVSASGLDFHLLPAAAAAIDQGAAIAEGGLDMDGRAHDHGAPDLGADEYEP